MHPGDFVNEMHKLFASCHTSGHILEKDIVRFVYEVNPRQVVPVHTESAEKFQELFQNALLLPDGCPFVL